MKREKANTSLLIQTDGMEDFCSAGDWQDPKTDRPYIWVRIGEALSISMDAAGIEELRDVLTEILHDAPKPPEPEEDDDGDRAHDAAMEESV